MTPKDTPLAGPCGRVGQGVFLAASPRAVKMWAAVGESLCAVDGSSREVTGRVRSAATRTSLSPAIFFHQIDDAAPELGVLDPHESLGQGEAFGGGEEIGHIGRRWRFLQPVVMPAVRRGRAFEEERHRNLQDVGDLLQPAGADAVGAFFVFLHLLEGQTERVAELFLAHAEHHSPHPYAAADVLVDGVRGLFRHITISYASHVSRNVTHCAGSNPSLRLFADQPIKFVKFEL